MVMATFLFQKKVTVMVAIKVVAVIQAIQNNPDIDVEFVECYDDICLGCELIKPSPTTMRNTRSIVPTFFIAISSGN